MQGGGEAASLIIMSSCMYTHERAVTSGDPHIPCALVWGLPVWGVSDTLHEVSDLAESRLARNY